MPIPPQLEAIAARLERKNLALEAQAIRAVNAAYRNLSLTDLIALVRQAGDNPSPTYRVQQVDRLMNSFYGAVRELETPPAALVPLLENAVRVSVSALEEMLEGSILEAFRVTPVRELEFSRYAADRLTKYWGSSQQKLAADVQSVLIEGLGRGSGIQQIAGQLRERANVSKSRARLIARTETARASSHAQRESQLEAGITEFYWKSAADLRVRPLHRARNGRVYPWDGDILPGVEPNCRCVSLAVIPEG